MADGNLPAPSGEAEPETSDPGDPVTSDRSTPPPTSPPTITIRTKGLLPLAKPHTPPDASVPKSRTRRPVLVLSAAAVLLVSAGIVRVVAMRSTPRPGAIPVLATARTEAEPVPPAMLSALVRAANEAANDLRLVDSRDAWMQVWRFRRDRVATCNIGELSLSIGDYPRAAQFLSACVSAAPKDALTEGDRFHVLSLARARQRVGEVAVRAPDGAEIAIDGAFLGPAPLDDVVFLEPGPHRIRAVLHDRSKEITMDAAAGGTYRVNLEPTVTAPTEHSAYAPLQLACIVVVVAGVSFALGRSLSRQRAP